MDSRHGNGDGSEVTDRIRHQGKRKSWERESVGYILYKPLVTKISKRKYSSILTKYFPQNKIVAVRAWIRIANCGSKTYTVSRGSKNPSFPCNSFFETVFVILLAFPSF